MKILDISEFYSERGGAVKLYTEQKFRAAARRGIELVVIAPGPEDHVDEREGGRIVWIKGPPMPVDPRYHLLLREKAVHTIVDLERPDLLEASSPWTSGWFAARYREPIKRAFIFHQDPIARYPHTAFDRFVERDRLDRFSAPYWAYLRRLSSRFDATIVASDWLANRLRAFALPFIEPIQFGIDKERYSPSLSDPSIRRALLDRAGVFSDAYLFIGISDHIPAKRVFTLIDALAEVNARNTLEKPVAFTLYGDGPLRPLLEQRARKVEHLTIASLVGEEERLPAALASADAFLHGAAAETFSEVTASALASGLPLVVPSAGGASDFADPAFSERYEPGSFLDCADAIERLLRRDLDQLREDAIKVSATKVRSIDDHFGALFAYYTKLLES